MKVEKAQFHALLRRLIRQKPEKTQAVRGIPQPPKPIISKTPSR
jgi:hypothetical protein